ncbi:ABC transporter substrate-binding protein [Nakamurella alba]|nr:ABC transporter substrate-binding protein [Nakamurella alba]
MKLSLVRRAVPAMVIALGVTACGSSADTSGSTSSGGGGGDGGIHFQVTAAVGSSLTNYPDVEAGANAAVAAINKAGGVNGKQITMTFCNTRGDVNQAMACARQADTDGADAVLGRVDIYSPQTLPIIEAAKIPDIGSVSTGADLDYVSPITFPLAPGTFGAYAASPQAFKDGGAKSMVVVTVDLGIGIKQAEVTGAVGEAIGLEVKPMIKVPTQGVTDFTPFAQQVKDSGADAVLIQLGPTGGQAFVKAADAIGLQAQLGGTAFSLGQSEGAGLGALASRLMVTSPYPSTDDLSVDGIARYNKELDDNGVAKDPALRRLAGLNAWLSVYAAAEVAKTIQGDVTKESMLEALGKAKDIDLFDLVTFSPADLGTDVDADAYPRFPKVPYHALTFDGAVMKDAGQPEIPDPFGPIRG